MFLINLWEKVNTSLNPIYEDLAKHIIDIDDPKEIHKENLELFLKERLATEEDVNFVKIELKPLKENTIELRVCLGKEMEKDEDPYILERIYTLEIKND